MEQIEPIKSKKELAKERSIENRKKWRETHKAYIKQKDAERHAKNKVELNRQRYERQKRAKAKKREEMRVANEVDFDSFVPHYEEDANSAVYDDYFSDIEEQPASELGKKRKNPSIEDFDVGDFELSDLDGGRKTRKRKHRKTKKNKKK